MKITKKSAHPFLPGHATGNSRRMAIYSFILLTSLLLMQCDLGKKMDNATDTIAESTDKVVAVLDDAINGLNNTSADWQVIIQKALKDLPADVQSTIRTEITNSLNRGVAAAGVEVRCGVDFIRKRVAQDLQSIKARLIGGNPPPKEPYFCQAVPGALDMALSPERRNILEYFGYDFDMTKVKVFLVNGDTESDVTQFLDQPTHYHMTLNLGGTGIRLTEQSKRFILRWNDRTISTVGIMQAHAKVCETELVNIDLPARSFIPRHKRGGGDQEFNGNGPRISCMVKLINLGTRIDAQIYMLARETKSDWTTAQETITYTVYTADPGKRIENIIGPTTAEFSYVDNDHREDPFDGNGPVARFVFSGDGEGKDAGIHTGVTITYNRIRVQVKETADCVPASTVRTLAENGRISTTRLRQIRAENPNIRVKPNN
jgi:hypothetical protein